ncbi:MAG: SRPBCC family protein [Hyphomonadaceae bacterium]
MSDVLELKLDRFLNAPRAKIWRAWSDPKHLKEWWCPKPWTTEVKEFDFRPGGGFHTYMTGPDGKGGTGESDNPGCFLEIVPREKIVTTSQLGGGWRPLQSWMPMTAIVTFADEGDGTRYIARALHTTPEHLKQHEEMGFHEGWGTVAGQLEEYANAL